MSNGEAVVEVATYPQIEGPVAFGNTVLNVEGKLLYVRMSVKWERDALRIGAVVIR